MVPLAAHAGATIIDINVEDNPFGDIAVRSGGAAVRAPAAEAVPALVEAIVGSVAAG